jgi:GNAT superfamily N-acetyltransferase
MIIRKSQLNSLKEFERFWQAALAYQTERNLPLWSPFPETMILDEIGDGRHFSGFVSGNILAGFFSVAHADPFIWGDQDRGDAIYIHRMCVNPDFKGHNFAAKVLAWACDYAAARKCKFVRMDTWAKTRSLVDYYVRCGFNYIGDKKLSDTSGLPPHYRDQELALFENEI